MPAVSKKQQRFFGIVRSIQKGEQKPTTPETAKAASSMKMKSVKKFAKTKHKGLPEKKNIKEESCGKGEYYCYDDKKCKPIPEGMKVGKDGMLVKEMADFSLDDLEKPIKKEYDLTNPRERAAYSRLKKMGKNPLIKKVTEGTTDPVYSTKQFTKFGKSNYPKDTPFIIDKFIKNRAKELFKFKTGIPLAKNMKTEDVKTELLTKANERHKKAKSFKQFRRDSQKPLKKGEVRKYDPTSKSYKSNMADEYEPKLQEKSAAWQRKEGKNKSGGLNEKGRKSYERENPGSDLKAPQPEGGPRKRSFCARMGGVKGPMKKPDGSPTRKALALRKWKC